MTPLIRRFGAWVAGIGIVLGGLLVPMAAHAGNPAITFTQAFGTSSIAVNASTSLTFTLSNAPSGTTATSGSITDMLPAGLVVATPNGLSGTCLNAPYNGSVTATAGASGIYLSNLILAASGSCTVAVNVTGTSEGSKVNGAQTFTYNSGSVQSNSATLTVTAAAVAPPPPAQPIPNREPATPNTGIGTQPTTVDLSKGQGPDMTVCMMNAVKGMAGFGQAVYLGQDQFGVASIDLKDGRYLAFYPLAASTTSTRAPGLYFSDNNKASLATSCGSFDLAPAVYNLAKLGELLAAGQTTDVRLNINSDGVTTYARDGNVYVVRPEFYVSRGASGTAGLTQVGDAYSFNDGAGSTQLLRGAFSDIDALRAALASGGLTGTVVGQADGAFLFTFSYGDRYLLQAEVQLLPASSGPSDKLFKDNLDRQRGSGTFLYRGSTLSMWQKMKYTYLGTVR